MQLILRIHMHNEFVLLFCLLSLLCKLPIFTLYNLATKCCLLSELFPREVMRMVWYCPVQHDN